MQIPKLQIDVLAGPETGASFSYQKDCITLGRAGDNDVALPSDSAVSARHARLIWQETQWFVEDMGSKNGTFIEKSEASQKVETPRALTPGQQIVMGESVLALEMPRPAESENADAQEKAVLRVDLEEGQLKFQFLSDGAYGSRYSMPFQKTDIADLNTRLRRIAACAHTVPADAAVMDDFNDIGSFIGEHVIPRRIAGKLAETSSPTLFLIHHRALASIPWELARIDDEFLCRRFAMGRQMMVDDLDSIHLQKNKPHKARILIVNNPTGDLPQAQQETQELLDLLHHTRPDIEVEYLAGERVERVNLLTRLDKADIVYFVGHAEHDAETPANSGWLLNKGRVTCADFRGLHSPPTLVFANGCETGREASRIAINPSCDDARGIASSFILAGVRNYIGAIWPIAPAGAGVLARHFFASLAQGYPVGQSLAKARESVVEGLGAKEIVWASYVLYGDPARTFWPRPETL